MTRKLFYLFLILSLGLQTSCTMFESDKTVSASDLEGEMSDVDVEIEDEDDFSDLEDLEPATEVAQESAAPGGQQNAYGEIEDFNTDLIDSELEQAGVQSSTESQAAAAAPTEAPMEDDELDIEVADVTIPAAVESTGTPGIANNKITNLEYKSFESGGTVVITAEQTFDYQVREEPQFNQTVIEIADIQLPEKFKLPYIAKDFGQPVATINAYQENGATTARVVIQYKNSTKPSIEKKNNSLLVMNSNVGGGSSGEAPILGGDEDTDVDMEVTSVHSSPVSGKVAENRPITLEMDDVEIREVIKLIADEVNINIIMDSSIKGPTSVHLKKVPWEEALSIILKSHALGYVRHGNVMRIAPQEALTKEATDFAERVNKEEQAKLALAKRKVKVFPVNYADVDDLAGKLGPFLSGGAGNQATGAAGSAAGMIMGRAVGDKRSNSIVVTDYEEVIGRIGSVIRALDIPPLQVLLEGKIVEANENFLREFGVQWTSTNSDLGIGGKTGTLVSTVRGDGVPQAPGLFQQLTIGSFDILGEISAILGILEREEKVKVLSSPRVMAINKEKSMIRQATQFPITQATVSNGVVTTSVSFQDAVLSMEVTPQVTFTGDTILDIKVQRDVPGALNSGGNVAINKREASGKVLVKNGQTMVMGGIYDMNESVAEAGVPWLKDIPVLGYLFKSRKKQIVKNELVIFMTPKIVNPDMIKQMARIEELQGPTTSPDQPASGAAPNDPDLDSELEAL